MDYSKIKECQTHRPVKRIPLLLNRIEEIWLDRYSDDLRFFQFISYVEDKIKKATGKDDLFYLEDDELYDLLDKLFKKTNSGSDNL